MSFTYDFELIVSKDSFKENLAKLMSSNTEALTLSSLIGKTQQLIDRPDLLQLYEDSTVEYSWAITPSLHNPVNAPPFDLVVDTMKLKGVVPYVFELSKNFKNVDYLDVSYYIECHLLYTFPDGSIYSFTKNIELALDRQGLYGNPDSDISLSLYSSDFSHKGRDYFINDQGLRYEYLLIKGLYMHIIEVLEAKYAMFKPELQTWNIADFKIDGFNFPSVNILKPWKRFDSRHPLDTVMVFGKELIQELNLNKIEWDDKNINYYKWLKANILWLNSPRELVKFGKYQVPDNKRNDDFKHYESLKEILPNSVLEYGDVRKLVVGDDGNISYENAEFKFEHLTGFVFDS